MQLTASANSGYTFLNWTGDATGTANPVSVTMNGNKSVTANFSPPDTTPPSVHWVTPVGDGQVHSASSGVVQLEVSATDSSGIHHVTFSRWDAVNLRTVEIAADYSAPYQTSLDVSTLNMDWNEIDTDAV